MGVSEIFISFRNLITSQILLQMISDFNSINKNNIYLWEEYHFHVSDFNMSSNQTTI